MKIIESNIFIVVSQIFFTLLISLVFIDLHPASAESVVYNQFDAERIWADFPREKKIEIIKSFRLNKEIQQLYSEYYNNYHNSDRSKYYNAALNFYTASRQFLAAYHESLKYLSQDTIFLLYSGKIPYHYKLVCSLHVLSKSERDDFFLAEKNSYENCVKKTKMINQLMEKVKGIKKK